MYEDVTSTLRRQGKGGVLYSLFHDGMRVHIVLLVARSLRGGGGGGKGLATKKNNFSETFFFFFPNFK